MSLYPERGIESGALLYHNTVMYRYELEHEKKLKDRYAWQKTFVGNFTCFQQIPTTCHALL
jgi:hypothetical protein